MIRRRRCGRFRSARHAPDHLLGQNPGAIAGRLAGDRRAGAVHGNRGRRREAASDGLAVAASVRAVEGDRRHARPLSHGYDDVDYQVLWDAAQKDLPVLLATVEQMLKEL